MNRITLAAVLVALLARCVAAQSESTPNQPQTDGWRSCRARAARPAQPRFQPPPVRQTEASHDQSPAPAELSTRTVWAERIEPVPMPTPMPEPTTEPMTGPVLSPFASEPHGTLHFNDCPRCRKDWLACECESDGKGWTVFGEWLLLQPRGADPVFAVRARACSASNPPLATEQIDFGAFSGFQAGLAKTVGDGRGEIEASFTHFESDESRNAAAPVGFVLRPTITLPAANIRSCDDNTSFAADADAGIHFERVSLDYRRHADCGCVRLDGVLGFAYGQLNQDLKAVFDLTTAEVASDAYGYGVHLGGGAEYGLGRLRIYGHLDLTLLASNAKARYRQTDAIGAVGIVADYQQGIDRIIPVLDFEAGAAIELTRHLTMRVGYLYSAWFNVVTVPSFIAAVQSGDVSGGTSDTLTFDGLFVRAELNW